MPNLTNITPPRVPLVDIKTGLVTREWYLFFLNLFTLAGAGSNDTTISDLAQNPETSGLLGTLASVNQDNVGYLRFNPVPSPTPSTTTVGNVYWDGGTTLNVNMTPNVVQSIGEDQFFYIEAQKASGAPGVSVDIVKGQVVMFTGSIGNSGVLTGQPATGITDGAYIMGVAAENIAVNTKGLVQSFGLIEGVNTGAWADGTILYYDPATLGGLTDTVPSAPNVKATVAAVVKGNANGSLFVRPTYGSALGQTDSNVQFTSLADKNIIQYDSALQYWKNVTVAAAITSSTSFTANGVVYAGTTSTLATDANFTWTGTDLHVNGKTRFGSTSAPTYTVDITGTMRISGNIGFFSKTPAAQYTPVGAVSVAVAGATNTVYRDTEFTGNTGANSYTIGDIVRALKIFGLIAT